MSEPLVRLDTSRIYEIEERSDFDHHAPIAHEAHKLGEDWGEGFYVDAEPVVVFRDQHGAVARTVPVSDIEAMALMAKEKAVEEPNLADPVATPRRRTTSEREQLVFVLAKRLFDHYKAMGPNLKAYNPLTDGIPEMPPGSRQALNPLPGTKLYPATGFEVFQWLIRIIAARVSIVDKKQGNRGYRGDASDYAMRIKRSTGS